METDCGSHWNVPSPAEIPRFQFLLTPPPPSSLLPFAFQGVEIGWKMSGRGSRKRSRPDSGAGGPANGKKKPRAEEELDWEVSSVESSEDERVQRERRRVDKHAAALDEAAAAETAETADEKRLRVAKRLLAKLEAREAARRAEDASEEEESDEEDGGRAGHRAAVASQLAARVEQARGVAFRRVAATLRAVDDWDDRTRRWRGHSVRPGQERKGKGGIEGIIWHVSQ